MASKNTSLYGGCFLLAGMSSASGALPFYGRAGHLLCSHQLPVCVTGEWSFLQGTQAYQLSITQKKRAPCEDELLCVDYFPVLLSALPVDVPKEE